MLEEYVRNGNATRSRTGAVDQAMRAEAQPAPALSSACNATTPRGCITISGSKSDGVLTSWAIPKGPSLDPACSRLAVHVEDHPLEYSTSKATFRRVSTAEAAVMLWDRGSYELLDADVSGGRTVGARRFQIPPLGRKTQTAISPLCR